MCSITLFSALFAFPLLAEAALTYSIKTNYSGPEFFREFNFYEGLDVNKSGNVHFLNRQDAITQQLVGVNSAGNAFIKVDNQTVGSPTDPIFGRNSVRITTIDSISQGSLILFDAVHLPFGCSVWGAIWSVGGGTWPNSGEIDIVEGVNLQSANEYSLHTLQGCQHPPVATGETGAVLTSDCWNQTNGNSGCIVRENTPNSFGAGFAPSGGGAYATLWNADGIKMWFFPRSSIPADFSGSSPNPANWSTPSVIYPTSTCNTSQFFGPQTVVIDITICGNFAAQQSLFSPSCGYGMCVDLVRTPTNYNDAYFELKYLRVFTENDGSTTTTITSSATSVTSQLSPSSSSSSISGGPSSVPIMSWTPTAGMLLMLICLSILV